MYIVGMILLIIGIIHGLDDILKAKTPRKRMIAVAYTLGCTIALILLGLRHVPT